jgi:nitric oxide synthase oxygenase domain/subunit
MSAKHARLVLHNRLVEFGRQDIARESAWSVDPIELVHGAVHAYRNSTRPLIVQLAMERLMYIPHAISDRWTPERIDALAGEVAA